MDVGCQLLIMTSVPRNTKEVLVAQIASTLKPLIKKKRYADRQKQMDLAKQRNQKHIGSKSEVRQR